MNEVRLLEKGKWRKRLFTAVYIKICAIILAVIMEIPHTRSEYVSDEQNGFVAIFALYGCLVIHELIRSLFLKKHAYENKVYFGMKYGLVYAATPGSVFTKTTYTMSCIIPFIIIISSLVFLLFIGLLPKLIFLLVGFFYAMLRSKDFYWLYEIMLAPKQARIKIIGAQKEIDI